MISSNVAILLLMFIESRLYFLNILLDICCFAIALIVISLLSFPMYEELTLIKQYYLRNTSSHIRVRLMWSLFFCMNTLKKIQHIKLGNILLF